MAGASDKAPKKVDMVAQKRVQYGRVLYPPQEKGFKPDAWIAKIESPDMTRGEFGLIEDLLDARSRLYSAAERLRREDHVFAVGITDDQNSHKTPCSSSICSMARRARPRWLMAFFCSGLIWALVI